MKSALAKKLIAHGAIKSGTKVEAHYRALGLSCSLDQRVLERFIIRTAKGTPDGGVHFEAVRMGDGKLYRFASELVETIDGMTAARTAEMYSLNDEGETVVIKRRGRRPRVAGKPLSEEASVLDYDEDDDDDE